MYSKTELQNKSLEELQAIADEYGISSNKKDHAELMYDIIDHESVSAAQKATDKPKKRSRIKTVDLVYSANQLKAKKIDKQKTVTASNTLFDDLSAEEKEMLEDPAPVAAEPVAEALVEEAPKKKRGRQKKEEAEAAVEPLAEEAPKKKRGRPKKEQPAAEPEPANEPATEPVAETEATSPLANNQETAQETEVKPRQKTSLMDFSRPQKEEAPEVNEPEAEPTTKETNIATVTDDGTDFIIIEDIPNELNNEEHAQLSYFKQFNHDQHNNYEPQEAADNYGVEATQASSDEPNIEFEPYNFNNIVTISGVLDLSGDFGFLRSSDYNYLSSPDDIYVNPSQVQHYGLKTGDVVEGTIRPPREGEKFFPLVNINKINGCAPAVVRDRVPFEYLTPLFPEEKFKLCSGKNDSPSSRIVDLFSPIGKGQRALIVAQPKTGKTLLMKDIANSIARNHPEAYLMMLLIDERPEEVTDMARTVNAEVIASTFDAPADNHVRIANIVLEKAKRMVECGHDVVIFLDSITRLARAYNTVSPASGKVLTGGVDANALQKPKRFFGAARNIEGGGSLTIIATALIDTGSKMDEVIFEEFKGTGNMELQLDRALSNKRIFPAVNLIASSTRRDDLLQDENTRRRMWIIRNHIADMTNLEAMDTILKHIERTESNEEFLATMNG